MFLADENFRVEITNANRQAEHDLAWVGDLSPGIADEGVVALAVETGRTIHTFDKDFGNLTFQHGVSIPAGVILFRARADSPTRSASAIVDLLASHCDWAGDFTVVDNSRFRMARLPKPDVGPIRYGTFVQLPTSMPSINSLSASKYGSPPTSYVSLCPAP